MKQRGSPILLITIAIVMIAGLTMINSGMDPPKDPDAIPAVDDHDSGQEPTTNGPTISPDQMKAEIDGGGEGGPAKGTPAAPTKTRVQVQDRDDEGSGFWWTDKTQPNGKK